MSEENSYPPMFSPSPPSHPHLFPSLGLPLYPLPPRCFSSSHHLTPPSPRSSYFPSPTCVDFCFHLGCMHGPGIRNMFTCNEIRNTSSTCVSFVCINLYAHILLRHCQRLQHPYASGVRATSEEELREASESTQKCVYSSSRCPLCA